MSNPIADRLADFIGNFPPFQLLEKEQLQLLAGSASVTYTPKGTVLFRESESPFEHFFMVQQGKVKIYIASEGNRLIDECDTGDIFGVRPLIAKEPYLATAEVEEDALLCLLPVQVFEPFLESNPKLALYFAAGFASGKPAARKDFLQTKGGKAFEVVAQAPMLLRETQVVQPGNKPLTGSARKTIREAAEHMTIHGSSAMVIIDENRHPIGIVTDTDFRKKVATGAVKLDRLVSDIMSKPVATMAMHTTNGEATVRMLQLGIHHIVLTEDGSPDSPVAGVLSDEDLLVAEGRSPAALLRSIRRAEQGSTITACMAKADQLVKGFIEAQVHPPYISGIMTALHDAVIERCIEIAVLSMGAQPPVQFCWLTLGSAGRQEQIIRTDQDNALVFEEVEAAQLESTRAYFLEMSQKVNTLLAEVGFEYDQAGIMAGNHRWCNSVQEWATLFDHWVQTPDEENILFSTIFFDFRGTYGKQVLARTLSESLYAVLKKQPKFLAFMAKDALTNPPPLSFFRQFMVEKSGEHKDAFDLKLKAMLPLVDAARVLALQYELVDVNNTPQRYRRIAANEPANSVLFEEAAEAFEILQGFRARFAVSDSSSGRYIAPDRLSKLDRQALRNIFSIISEVQQVLEVRFQLGYLRG